MQNRLKSWALGSSELQFAAGAVCNAVTQRVYAVVRHASARNAASIAQELLVSWPAASTGGSIANFAATTGTALAQAVHALHPAEGSRTASAPAAVDGTAAAQSDTGRAAAHSTGEPQAPQPIAEPHAEDSSTQQAQQAGVFVVLCDSSVTLGGSHTNGGSEPRPADCHAVASAADGSTLAVVSAVGKARDTLVEVYQAQVCASLSFAGFGPLDLQFCTPWAAELHLCSSFLAQLRGTVHSIRTTACCALHSWHQACQLHTPAAAWRECYRPLYQAKAGSVPASCFCRACAASTPPSLCLPCLVGPTHAPAGN